MAALGPHAETSDPRSSASVPPVAGQLLGENARSLRHCRNERDAALPQIGRCRSGHAPSVFSLWVARLVARVAG
jgi:hypothetical protein